MRAVVYTRVSLDRYGDASAVTRQHEDALKLIELRGWELVGEYQDNDISAAGKKLRPQFETMLNAAENKEFDAIVAWTFDRLARNRRDEIRLIESCQDAGVTLALVRGSDIDLSTPAGRLVADMMATTARHEIEVKSDRQKRANRQRAQAGKPHATRRAFGYEPGGITVRESEAKALRWAYEQILAGASLRSIARAWNEQGVPTAAGGEWVGIAVRQTLVNPRYAGLRYYRGARVSRGTWDPIVSEDTWQAVTSILNDPRRSTVKDRSVKFLLSSIAECGRCADGSKMATSRTQHGKRVYKCASKGDLARAANPIDELTVAVIIERLTRPDAIELLSTRSNDADIRSMRVEVNTQRQRMDEAAALFAAGTIRAEQLTTITSACEDAITDLEGQINAAAVQSPLTGLVSSDDVAAVWEALDISQQRAVVRALFKRVVIEPVKRGARVFDPASVTYEWNGAE